MSACAHCLDPEASEAWRHACEVRWLVAQPPEVRRAHLDGVKARRGEAAYWRLRNDAVALYRKQQPAKGAA